VNGDELTRWTAVLAVLAVVLTEASDPEPAEQPTTAAA
jgi:hypothetical protein